MKRVPMFTLKRLVGHDQPPMRLRVAWVGDSWTVRVAKVNKMYAGYSTGIYFSTMDEAEKFAQVISDFFGGVPIDLEDAQGYQRKKELCAHG